MISTEELYWNELYNTQERIARNNGDTILYEAIRPSTTYKPKLFLDGNMWCALYGDNLQDGVVGFGKSPAIAFLDFDKNWTAAIGKE